jgi:hypothetical protein
MAGLRKEVRHRARDEDWFGLYDVDGREIGYRCDIFEERWVLDPERATLFVVEEVLTHYTSGSTWVVQGRATRDDTKYGGVPYPRRVGSIEEALWTSWRMINAYREKAAKKFC